MGFGREIQPQNHGSEAGKEREEGEGSPRLPPGHRPPPNERTHQINFEKEGEEAVRSRGEVFREARRSVAGGEQPCFGCHVLFGVEHD